VLDQRQIQVVKWPRINWHPAHARRAETCLGLLAPCCQASTWGLRKVCSTNLGKLDEGRTSVRQRRV
jgi:hypothetical protein